MLLESNLAFLVLSTSPCNAKLASVTVLLVSVSDPVKDANLLSAAVLVYPALSVSTVAEPWVIVPVTVRLPLTDRLSLTVP